MSSAGKAFELGGIVMPLDAAFRVSQQVERAGGRSALRFANGASLRQQAWRKLRVVISGDGWSPLGLDALDFESTMTFKSCAPLAIRSNSNVITLPATRRTDAGYLPYAWAHLPNGPASTAVSISTNVATCVSIADAISYSVSYFPQLTVWADPPSQQFDVAGAASSWELILEEA